ncbi:MAG: hypothetical protein ACLFV2_09205 [Desulfurivibrionaceae bacterium]
MYPDECIQSLNEYPWWEEDQGKDYCRGRLCYAHVPHVVQTPLTLHPEARSEDTNHREVDASIEQMRISQKKRIKALPLAGLPLHHNELYTVYKAKVRPCLIIGDGWDNLPEQFTKNRPGWQRTPIITVIPYYGIEKDGSRAAFPPAFIERVRHCEYPQFFWDILPTNKKESLLILSHLQPVGRHHDSIELTPHRLHESALVVMDEYLRWSLGHKRQEDDFISLFKGILTA